MVYSFFRSVQNWAPLRNIHYFGVFRRAAASSNQRVNRTARVSFFLKIEKLLKDVLSINLLETLAARYPNVSF